VEWVLLEPLLPAAAATGRPRGDLREILCGIFYMVDNGCKWWALPHDLPPWQTCWRWWARLNEAEEGQASVWDEIVAALRGADRVGKGRAQEPTAAIVDSQSAKSSEGGQGRSFDANKRVNGRKRHAFVDVEGNLLLVGLTGAGTSDTAAAKELLTQLRRTCPNLRVIWCDQGYKASFVEAARELGLEVVVVCRQPGTRGFAVLPQRWVVERFFAWISRARRLARDFERAVWSARGMIQAAYARMLLRRLARACAAGARA
jgi:transposase